MKHHTHTHTHTHHLSLTDNPLPVTHTPTPQIKDAVRDGLRAVKNVLDDGAVVAGAGAWELAAAAHLRAEVGGTAQGGGDREHSAGRGGLEGGGEGADLGYL